MKWDKTKPIKGHFGVISVILAHYLKVTNPFPEDQVHMLRIRYILFFVFLQVGRITILHAQDRSNKGKEFWLAYSHNVLFTADNPVNAQTMVLYLSAEKATDVTISIGGTTWSQTISIPAKTVDVSVVLPKSGADDCRITAEGKSNKGIHIVATEPIVAYTHQFGIQSSAATMLLPVETFGYGYFAVGYNQTSNYPNSFSWTYAIASEDNTRVVITPSDSTQGGYLPGQTYTVDLNKGEVINLFGKSTGTFTSKDLSGTKISSVAGADGKCHPIALFSGASRMTICSGDGGEFMQQQIFPASAWGTSYLTYHTINNTGTNVVTPFLNFYRVSVSDPSTVVKRNGVVLSGLLKNFYYQFSSTSGDFIEADKPILVTAYMPSSNQCTGTVNPPNGDPEMFILSPLQQGIKYAQFYNTRKQNIDINYVDLIVHKNGLPSLRIDNVPVTTGFIAHPQNADYVFVAKRLLGAGSQHTVSCDSTFTGRVYGLGQFESYGYLLGTLVNNLNSYGSLQNTYSLPANLPNTFTCPKTPVQFTISVAYKLASLQWQFSKVAALQPQSDTTLLNPVPNDSTIIFGRKYYTYRLSKDVFFKDTGTFFIPVKYTSPEIDRCDKAEETTLPFDVKAGPTADFSAQYTTCPTDTAFFTNTSQWGAFAGNRYRWLFDDGSVDSSQNTAKRFVTDGNHPVGLRIVTDEGCVGDTVKTTVTAAGPKAQFGAPAFVCLADSVLITDSSSYANGTISSWNWNFGDGNSQTRTNAPAFARNYADTGRYTISLWLATSTGCKSDTVRRTVAVVATALAAFNAVGLPCEGQQLQLQSTSPVAGIASWHWQVGQNPPVSSSSSTSLLLPLSYPDSFVVKHWLTSSSGCLSDTVAGARIFVLPRPSVSFTFDSALRCVGAAIPFTGNATVPGGGVLRYNWTFGDDSTATSLSPSHIYRLSRDFNVQFWANSAAGCASDTATNVVRIFAFPEVDAGPEQTIFLGGSALLQAVSNGSYGYNWQPAATLSNASELRPTASPSSTTVYTITATSTPGNCRSADSVRVVVLLALNFPNAFSPNADGINDVWSVAGLSSYVNADLNIFDRYGTRVFTSRGYNNPWNGTRNGTPLPVGVYYYVLNLNDGKTPAKSGSVTLLR